MAALAVAPTPSGAAVPGLTFTQTGCEGYSDSVARLYSAGLGRTTEQAGFEFWMGEYTAGRQTFTSMAAFFVASTEFQNNYGALTNLGFVQQIYRNVLGREGEAEGVNFWTGQLDAGVTRASILMRFAESPENIARTGTVEPTLGFFNNGLSAAWTCDGLPALPASACNILSRTASTLTVEITLSNVDTTTAINPTIEIAGRIDGDIVETSTQTMATIAPRQTGVETFVLPFPLTAQADPAARTCSFVTKSLI